MRRTALLCAALVLCAALTLPALADGVPAVYELLYRVSPATAQYFRSVRMSCEDQGVRMEVISAYAQDDNAQIYFTLQDLTGDRLSQDADLFESYSIHASWSMEADCDCVDYEPGTRTATFLLTMRRLDGKKIAGDKITFTLNKALGSRAEGSAAIPPSEIARLTVYTTQQVPETKLRGWGGTEEDEIDPAQLAAALFVIAAVPALCEEFFFRGVLLPSLLRRLRPGAAIVLGGCLFGLVHGDLSALPGHVLLGIGLCLVAYWTRSIWYVVVWHFLQNGIAVFITYFSGAMLEALGTAQSAAAAQEPAFLFLGGVLLLIPFSVGTALFLALLWITTRSHRSAPLPRAEGRAPAWVWAPVLVALLCAACLYALSGVQMAGGGL